MVDMQRRELDGALARERQQQVEQDSGIEPAGKPGAHPAPRGEARRDGSGHVRAQVYSATSLNLP